MIYAVFDSFGRTEIFLSFSCQVKIWCVCISTCSIVDLLINNDCAIIVTTMGRLTVIEE